MDCTQVLSIQVMTWSVFQYFNVIMKFLVMLRNDYNNNLRRVSFLFPTMRCDDRITFLGLD